MNEIINSGLLEIWNVHVPLTTFSNLPFQKRPKIKLKRTIAIQFALTKFFHHFSAACSRIGIAFHKLTQPILVIDKHRGSEMFATLSLHRLAIILAFLVTSKVTQNSLIVFQYGIDKLFFYSKMLSIHKELVIPVQ
jgi:hypothetical protein